MRASDETKARMHVYLDRCTGFVNQRKREDLRVNKVLAERKLRPVPGYQPQFRAYPIEVQGDRGRLHAVPSCSKFGSCRLLKGRTDEEIVRAAFMLWYQTSGCAHTGSIRTVRAVVEGAHALMIWERHARRAYAHSCQRCQRCTAVV